MTTVLVFGTFDIVHPGHLDFFRQAREYGDRLVVCVARDATSNKVKGRKPTHSEQERFEAIQKVPLVDKAVFGYLDDYYRIIEEVHPEVIALGYDQKNFTDTLRTELSHRKLSCKVVRLKPYEEDKYKSSKILLKKL